jgi:predicted nucleic acid-binding protein
VEKDMKYLLLPIFFTSNYYLPISELENSEGYTDIYLMRSYLHPKAISEWIWELKYIKQADSENKTLIEAAQKDAIEQLQRYKSSNIFKDKTDVRYLAIVFVGKKEYTVTEI